jgi:tRNA (adenine22-N1)-methyltransferase
MLNKRLDAVKELIEPCDVLMDVGSDHGFLPLYLLSNRIIKKAVIGDLNHGPLEQARKNFRDFTNLNYVFVLSDGISAYHDKLDAVVIAGMGFETIQNILVQDINRFKEIPQIIIQSNTKVDKLREFLNKNDFTILDELLVKDRKYYYPVIKVKYNQNCLVLNQKELLFGPILIKKNLNIFKDYLIFNRRIEEKILKAQKKESSLRIQLIDELLNTK